MNRRILIYSTLSGVEPYTEWFLRRKHREVRARIRTRLVRAQLGLLGDYKALGGGLYELRMDALGGVRVYFAMPSASEMLVLCGGTKGSQVRDISKARSYWRDYAQRYKTSTPPTPADTSG
jgi:putative addiction module killer protein